MKIITKPAASKLVKKIDNELKDILTNDLKSFTAKNPFKPIAIPVLAIA